MIEEEHRADAKLFDILVLWFQSSIGLFALGVLAAALLPLEVALPLSIMALVLINALLGTTVVISNALAGASAAAFQNSLSVMIHANSLHMDEDKFDFPAGSIDDVLRQSDTFMRASRAHAERLHSRLAGETSSSAGIAAGLAGQLAMLALASGLGLYFSAEVTAGIEWFADAAQSLR